MNIPYVFKKCTKCGRYLVASKLFFSKHKSCKYGLRSNCKECEHGIKKEYYDGNKDVILDKCKKYRVENKEHKKKYNQMYYQNNKDYFKTYFQKHYKNNKKIILQRNKKWRIKNREQVIEYRKNYYQQNKDRIIQYKKEYQQKNKEYLNEVSRKYYNENKERLRVVFREYRKSPKGTVTKMNSDAKRRIKINIQTDGITKDQWLEMMKYFDFKCAYSGKILSEGIRSIDHVIPLNNDGEHKIWNLVPMLRKYNSSKSDKEILEWYKKQTFYSEERLNKIYEWQKYAYEKWGVKNDFGKIKSYIE